MYLKRKKKRKEGYAQANAQKSSRNTHSSRPFPIKKKRTLSVGPKRRVVPLYRNSQRSYLCHPFSKIALKMQYIYIYGRTNFILRIKEQETHLTLLVHDDDDNHHHDIYKVQSFQHMVLRKPEVSYELH
jgi:hypothetical protein